VLGWGHLNRPPLKNMDVLDYVGTPQLDQLECFSMNGPTKYLSSRANQRNSPANRYLNEFGSQVDMIRIEPGTAGGIGVVIVLEFL